MTTTAKRFGKPWTINESIRLQREFELLELSIDAIATRHQRTPNAIMFKLDQEGLSNYNLLYTNYYNLNSTTPTTNIPIQSQEVEVDDDDSSDYQEEEKEEEEEEEEEEEDIDSLKMQVNRLEKQVSILTEMFMKNSKNKSVFSLFS
jgi:TATA-binding protein-associated factor Taf7